MQNEPLDKLRSMLAGLSGDQDKVEDSDWGLAALGLGLLVFTAFRTWDWLSHTLPGEWQVLAIVGLLAFDAGTVIWAHVRLSRAISKEQMTISLAMFILCFIGVALTSLGDTSFRSDSKFVPADLTNIIQWVVPLIVIANIGAYYAYKFTSPKAQQDRETRSKRAQLQAAEEKYRQDQQELDLLRRVGVMQMQSRASARGLEQAMGSHDQVDLAAQNYGGGVMDEFWHRMNMGDANKPPAPPEPPRPPSLNPLNYVKSLVGTPNGSNGNGHGSGGGETPGKS